MFSSTAAAEARFSTRPASRAWLRGRASPFVQRAYQDFYQIEPAVDGMRKGGTSHFLLGHANPIASAENVAYRDPQRALWGRELKQALRDRVANSVTLHAENFCEFFTTPGTFVDLDPEVKDRWGQPVARMNIQRHTLDVRATGHVLEKSMEVLRALEPDDLIATAAKGESKFLQGGTCRFGKDPATSVLDPDCRAHEVPNLYVTDGSFLPTSGGVPPTLTIVANAFRAASKIAARFRAREL